MRGILAGVVAAACWAAAEPALGRAFGTAYSERRLLSGLLGVGPAAAIAVHLGNGAAFGAVFERAGARGPLAGVLAAEAENAALWPTMALFERVHPACRSGQWPPLLRNGRVFAYEVVGHALFGAILGSLVARREPS